MIPSVDSIIHATRTVTGIDPRGGRRNNMALVSRRVAVVSLRDYRGMSYPEIGLALGVAHATARMCYLAARSRPLIMSAAADVRQIVDKNCS